MKTGRTTRKVMEAATSIKKGKERQKKVNGSNKRIRGKNSERNEKDGKE